MSGWNQTNCCCCPGCPVTTTNSMDMFGIFPVPGVVTGTISGVSVPVNAATTTPAAYKALDEFDEMTNSTAVSGGVGFARFSVTPRGMINCNFQLYPSTTLTLFDQLGAETTYASNSVSNGFTYILSVTGMSASGFNLYVTNSSTAVTRLYVPVWTNTPSEGVSASLSIVFTPFDADTESQTPYQGYSFPCEVSVSAISPSLPPFHVTGPNAVVGGSVTTAVFNLTTTTGGNATIGLSPTIAGQAAFHYTGSEWVVRTEMSGSAAFTGSIRIIGTLIIDYYLSGVVEMSGSAEKRTIPGDVFISIDNYTETTDRDWWQSASWFGGKLTDTWGM